ncbi:MAG: PadR family transcriptional regulator [Thermoplasmata archaeon]
MNHHGKGILKNIVLMALRKEDLTAYEIRKNIKNSTFNVYEPSSGVLYPILKSLANDGLIEVSQKENRKYYGITEKGKKSVIEKMDRFKDIMESEKEKYKCYGKIGMELEMLHKTIFTMDEPKIAENNEKILKILRDAEDKLKELW